MTFPSRKISKGACGLNSFSLFFNDISTFQRYFNDWESKDHSRNSRYPAPDCRRDNCRSTLAEFCFILLHNGEHRNDLAKQLQRYTWKPDPLVAIIWTCRTPDEGVTKISSNTPTGITMFSRAAKSIVKTIGQRKYHAGEENIKVSRIFPKNRFFPLREFAVDLLPRDSIGLATALRRETEE